MKRALDVPALARLSRREKQMLLGCGACVLLFCLYMFSPSDAQPGVELAAAPPPASAAPAPPPPPTVAAPPAVTPPVAPGPAASADGVVLKGVLGGGPRGGSAILLLPSGVQRRVPIGREVMPGVTLKAVGIGHAVLVGADGEKRIELASGAAQAQGTSSSLQVN